MAINTATVLRFHKSNYAVNRVLQYYDVDEHSDLTAAEV